AHHERPELLRKGRHRGGKAAYWKVLHTKQLIDQQADEQIIAIQYQYPALLARSTDGGPEELTEIDDGQQPAAYVGHTSDPGFDPGQRGITRLVENFTDLPQRRQHGLPSE